MNTRRRPRIAVLAAAALAATLGACGSGGSNDMVATSTASPAASTGTAPATTTATTGPATATSQAGTGQTSARPNAAAPERALPTSAGDYSEGFMQAWNSGDSAAMSTYAASPVVERLSGVRPRGALLRTACEATMCSYTDENGGRVTLTLDLAKVDAGSPQAITAVAVAL